MVQPLGLSANNMKAYVAYLFTNHDFDIAVDVLKLDHTPIRSIETTTLDGQVNLQNTENVARTATLTFFDPDRSMHLDADSPWEGAVFVDRMIRVRHIVTVPGVGKVTATPFVGPITRLSRNGDTIGIECQDKASLAIKGCPVVTVKKGSNAVEAIRTIMRRACGETRFRLPSGNKRKLPKAYSTGWADEASPWAVCLRIARLLNLNLFYSCDGYLTLARTPSHTAIYASGRIITAPVQVDYDVSSVSNIVRVSGTIAPKKKKTNKKDKANQRETKPTKVAHVAVAAPSHPMSPSKLGRNGVKRFLPTLITGQQFKSSSAARQLANTTLDRSLPMTSGVSFEMIPVFHLDSGDLISAYSSSGRVMVRLSEASIPLGVSGGMTVGAQRRVARGRRA